MTFAKRFSTPECADGMRKGKGSNNNGLTYKVFPNPNSSNLISIEYNFKEVKSVDLNITIYTLMGENVADYSHRITKSETGTVSIPTNEIAPGSYFVRIFDGKEYITEQILFSE